LTNRLKAGEMEVTDIDQAKDIIKTIQTAVELKSHMMSVSLIFPVWI